MFVCRLKKKQRKQNLQEPIQTLHIQIAINYTPHLKKEMTFDSLTPVVPTNHPIMSSCLSWFPYLLTSSLLSQQQPSTQASSSRSLHISPEVDMSEREKNCSAPEMIPIFSTRNDPRVIIGMELQNQPSVLVRRVLPLGQPINFFESHK